MTNLIMNELRRFIINNISYKKAEEIFEKTLERHKSIKNCRKLKDEVFADLRKENSELAGLLDMLENASLHKLEFMSSLIFLTIMAEVHKKVEEKGDELEHLKNLLKEFEIDISDLENLTENTKIEIMKVNCDECDEKESCELKNKNTKPKCPSA